MLNTRQLPFSFVNWSRDGEFQSTSGQRNKGDGLAAYKYILVERFDIICPTNKRLYREVFEQRDKSLVAILQPDIFDCIHTLLLRQTPRLQLQQTDNRFGRAGEVG